MKTAIIMMAMSVLGFTAQAQKATNKNSKTIVLVHGAWSDASSWDAVTPLLKAQGEEVIIVNLQVTEKIPPHLPVSPFKLMLTR
jgi:ABC-type metal ion transport system substrate-binding protein